MNNEGHLKTISIMRMLTESLDYCQSWEIQISSPTKAITVIFNYADPVDSVTWRFEPGYFNRHLMQLFDAAAYKNKFSKGGV